MAKQAVAGKVRFRCHRAEGGLWGGSVWWMLPLNEYGLVKDAAASRRHLLNTEVKPSKD